jgi:non-canonical purine NTP pyrophosphatase (RdgB/HAM1 family)
VASSDVEVYFVTTNRGKLISAREAFRDSGISLKWKGLNLYEPRKENAREIAVEKAKQAYELLKAPVFVVDAGFSIETLGGWPGTYVNFNLERLGLVGFLRLMEGEKGREASFFHVLAYNDGEKMKVMEERVDGRVAEYLKGTRQAWHWSDLALIFEPLIDGEPCGKTLGEMEEEEFKQEYRLRIRSENFSVYDQLVEYLKD